MSAPLIVQAPAGDLEQLFGPGPAIIVDARLPDGVAMHGAGALVFRLAMGPTGAVLRGSPPGPVGEELVTLDHAPPGLLAIVGPAAGALQRLAAWCEARGTAAPPILLAESGIAALPGLLSRALALGTEASRRAAAAAEQVARLRREAEDLREALAVVRRSRPAAAIPSVVLETAPATGAPPLRLVAGEPPRHVVAGVTTHGIAQIRFHVMGGATVGLSVRLIGGESGRPIAGWRVPPEALTDGWVVLETPEPAVGRAETAILVLAAEGIDGEVRLSRAEQAPDDPAMTIATLPPGARMVHPLHIDWADWNGEARESDPRLAPEQTLAGATLEGNGALGESISAGRSITLADGWRTARIRLGPVPEAAALLRCDMTLSTGAVEARLCGANDATATAWRPLVAGEALSLVLPLDGSGASQVIELRGTGPASISLLAPFVYGGAVARTADADGSLPEPPEASRHAIRAPAIRTIERAPSRGALPDATGGEALDATGTRMSEADALPAHGEVTLDAYQHGENWELLDLRVHGLRAAGERWAELKFKFGVTNGRAMIEFRRAPSWPRAFAVWPGTEADSYGDKFIVTLDGERAEGLDRIAPGRDRLMVDTLAALMPGIVDAASGKEATEACRKAAAQLALHLGGAG